MAHRPDYESADYKEGYEDGKREASKQWVGLSDEEIVTTIDNTHFNEDEFCFLEACINYCRAIEAKLREKNI